jgi:hypothetical protein
MTKNKFAPLPSLEILKTYLKVDSMSPSGLTWIKSYTNRVKAGSFAGSKGRYWRVSFKGKEYPAHRLIYFLAHSINPEQLDIDHIDQNKLNNNINNLRLVTRQQNNANTRSARNSTSKYKGVSFNKQSQKWVAQITKNYKQMYIGLFDCESDAAKAYNKQAIALYGEYALLNDIDE